MFPQNIHSRLENGLLTEQVTLTSNGNMVYFKITTIVDLLTNDIFVHVLFSADNPDNNSSTCQNGDVVPYDR